MGQMQAPDPNPMGTGQQVRPFHTDSAVGSEVKATEG